MATLTYHPGLNAPHDHGFVRLRAMFAKWRSRADDRAQLAEWTDRDMHDAGISRATLEFELNKPFWRG